MIHLTGYTIVLDTIKLLVLMNYIYEDSYVCYGKITLSVFNLIDWIQSNTNNDSTSFSIMLDQDRTFVKHGFW